jgi:hypothetical protein
MIFFNGKKFLDDQERSKNKDSKIKIKIDTLIELILINFD